MGNKAQLTGLGRGRGVVLRLSNGVVERLCTAAGALNIFLKKASYLRKHPARGDREVATHSFSTPRSGGVWKMSRENVNSSTGAVDNFASEPGCGFFWGVVSRYADAVEPTG